MKTEKKIEMKFSKIFSNFCILSDLTHLFIKADSKTVDESTKKNEEFVKIKKYMKMTGTISLITSLLGLTTFCMKSKMWKTKCFLGLMYFNLSPHFYVLGSHLGILFGLKSTIQNLNTVQSSSLDSRIFKKYIHQLFVENKEFSIEDIYKEKFQQDDSYKEIMGNNFVVNDYFFKNSDKYLDNKEDKNSFNIIPTENFKVKAPIYDCFLTRYIYTHSRRYIKKYKKLKED